MFRAGSLIYAIAIALIIAILSSSLILLAFNARSNVENSFIREKQVRNVFSALNYYLTNSALLDQSNKIAIDLFQQGSDSVEIAKKKWGLFEVLFCKAHQGSKYEAGTFLVGDNPVKQLTALYLGDQNQPLSLCGKTLIKGNSFIPAQGVKRAYVEGQSFIGNLLIDGNIQNSSAHLPLPNKEVIMDYSIMSGGNTGDSIVDVSWLNQNKSIINSFSSPTLVVTSDADIYLNNVQLCGNITIRSAGQIKISSNASINGVLVVAACIVIEDRSSIQFQGFARDSIIVGQDCKLNYPTNLCILANNRQKSDSRIILNSGAIITGNVMNFNTQDIIDKSVNINVGENCIVNGMVYSDGYVSLTGTINGSLYCMGFMLKTPSAVYANLLLNATINSSALPNHYVGCLVPTDSKRKALIKRLE